MTKRQSYITITHGMRGFFAVEIWRNPDGNFWEPWQSGIGSYKNAADAEPEAKQWATAEKIKFYPMGEGPGI